MLRVKLLGAEELKRRLAHVATQARPQIENALLRAGKLIEGEAKRTIYERFATKAETKRGITFETPHKHLWGKTGLLKSSLTTRPLGPGRVAVGSPVVYARIHEFGGDIEVHGVSRLASVRGRITGKGRKKQLTLSAVRAHTRSAYAIHIPARPYLGPALEHQQPAIRRKLEQAVEALLRGK